MQWLAPEPAPAFRSLEDAVAATTSAIRRRQTVFFWNDQQVDDPTFPLTVRDVNEARFLGLLPLVES